MNGLLHTKHHTTAFILPAVIILIHRSIPGICIVSHPVLIQPCVCHFIITKQRIFTFPWPDCRSNLSTTVARIAINTVIDLTCHRIGHIMFHKRAQCIHDRYSISTCHFHIIIPYHNILMTIFQKPFFIQFRTRKFLMCITIPDCDPPTAHTIYIASLHQDI